MPEVERIAPEDAEKLWKMIKGIRICMMTTQDADGQLRSRPMASQQVDFDGRLWFITSSESPKAEEIEKEEQVNLSYADKDDQNYVSVSGRARLHRDKETVKQHWSETARPWFPKGPDEPHICIVEVEVDKAELWDGTSATMIMLYGYPRARLTGKPYDGGDTRKMAF